MIGHIKGQDPSKLLDSLAIHFLPLGPFWFLKLYLCKTPASGTWFPECVLGVTCDYWALCVVCLLGFSAFSMVIVTCTGHNGGATAVDTTYFVLVFPDASLLQAWGVCLFVFVCLFVLALFFLSLSLSLSLSLTHTHTHTHTHWICALLYWFQCIYCSFIWNINTPLFVWLFFSGSVMYCLQKPRH